MGELLVSRVLGVDDVNPNSPWPGGSTKFEGRRDPFTTSDPRKPDWDAERFRLSIGDAREDSAICSAGAGLSRREDVVKWTSLSYAVLMEEGGGGPLLASERRLCEVYGISVRSSRCPFATESMPIDAAKLSASCRS